MSALALAAAMPPLLPAEFETVTKELAEHGLTIADLMEARNTLKANSGYMPQYMVLNSDALTDLKSDLLDHTHFPMPGS